jgi:hypothetical protein
MFHHSIFYSCSLIGAFVWWVLVEGHVIVKEGSIGVVYCVELVWMLMVSGRVLVEGWKCRIGLLVGLPSKFCWVIVGFPCFVGIWGRMTEVCSFKAKRLTPIVFKCFFVTQVFCFDVVSSIECFF